MCAIVLRRAGTRVPDALIHFAWVFTGAFSILLILLLARDLLLGGLGLAVMAARERRLSTVDAAILVCDAACVPLSTLLLFG